MAMQYSAGEIFEMACQIERNGARFYRKVATVADDDQTKELLLGLAAMEDEHEETFSAMKEELSGRERTEPAYDPDGEAALYVRAFADTRVFNAKADPCERLTGRETLEDILKMALGLEKDSIAFYSCIRTAVPEDLGRDKIDEVVKEEMAHVVTLSRMLTSL